MTIPLSKEERALPETQRDSPSFTAPVADSRLLANSIRALAMVVVEAGVSGFWHKCVGAVDDPRVAIIGIDRFGESAPAGVLFKHFGFTVLHVAAAVRRVIGKCMGNEWTMSAP